MEESQNKDKEIKLSDLPAQTGVLAWNPQEGYSMTKGPDTRDLGREVKNLTDEFMEKNYPLHPITFGTHDM